MILIDYYNNYFKMKIGFLLNVTFLLCFLVTQLLMWLLDGTLVNTFAELLNI